MKKSRVSGPRRPRKPQFSLRPSSTPPGPVILTLILGTFLLLAACESQPPPGPTSTVTPSPTIPTATSTSPPPTATITPLPTSSLGMDQSALNGVMIKFWHPWSGESGRVIQESIAEFNASNPYGISVESTYQGTVNSLNELIAGTQAGSELPNLSVGTNYQILSWNSAGKPVVGLNAYLDDPEWGLTSDELADFYPVFFNQDISGGNRIGFPAARSAQLLFYNQTWGKELGFTSPPTTPAEFKRQACRASRANIANDNPEDDGSGGWLVNTTPSAVLNWMYAFGGQVLDPEGDGYHFNTPQVEDALAYLKELFDEGCAFEVLESPPETEFANRKALFITGSLSDLARQQSEFDWAENNDHWIVLGFPTPDGEPLIGVYGPSFVMFAGTPRENLAAWLLIKWLASAEQQAGFVAASTTFSTRATVLELLSDFAEGNPRWAAAQDLVPFARPEPALQSWRDVRWVLADVGTQIFRYYFTPDRIPATLELMDDTAAELHERTQ